MAIVKQVNEVLGLEQNFTIIFLSSPRPTHSIMDVLIYSERKV